MNASDGYSTVSTRFTIDANYPPTVVGTGIADQSSFASFILSDNLSTYFSDVDGDNLTYTASSTTGTATITSGVLSISGLTPHGTTTVTVNASDGSQTVNDSFETTLASRRRYTVVFGFASRIVRSVNIK